MYCLVYYQSSDQNMLNPPINLFGKYCSLGYNLIWGYLLVYSGFALAAEGFLVLYWFSILNQGQVLFVIKSETLE